VLPVEEVRSRYYLRFDVFDMPGVLGSLAGVLGRHEISVASVLQHESKRAESVPVVITTHMAREGDVTAALEEIRRLPVVAGRIVRIRMLATNEGAAS
jgi:homoserine dehydrogenase